MKRSILLTAILILSFTTALLCSGERKIINITGEYTYYDDGTHSRNECMRIATDNARIDALARAFGTSVTQRITQTDRRVNNYETNDFLALSSSEVKGEWLGDTGDPEYEISYDRNKNLVVKSKVRGKAREIANDAVEFDTVLLRNGTQRSYADNRFRHGDDMFLYFSAPCDGYIRVYLEDLSRNVIELLPYTSDHHSKVKLRGGRDYVFFSEKMGKGEFGPENEYTLTAPDELEYNKVYVIFSPNDFSGPVMAMQDGLRTLNTLDFSKWLTKVRTIDPKMNLKTMTLEILPL